MFYELQSLNLQVAWKNTFQWGIVEQLGWFFIRKSKKYRCLFIKIKRPKVENHSVAYAGHQFGILICSRRKGPLLVNKLIQGNRLDIQLKGSGRTAFSRGGDGRATLYSMLREYLISEAMHGLGIPTIRSLAVVSTGEQVSGTHSWGAVLTRIASSHIRVGTPEYARAGSEEDLKPLWITPFNAFPQIRKANNPALELLRSVMDKQIALVVNWCVLGLFTVSWIQITWVFRRTTDYGPCAFMNAYHPKTVYSSIDSNEVCDCNQSILPIEFNHVYERLIADDIRQRE